MLLLLLLASAPRTLYCIANIARGEEKRKDEERAAGGPAGGRETERLRTGSSSRRRGGRGSVGYRRHHTAPTPSCPRAASPLPSPATAVASSECAENPLRSAFRAVPCRAESQSVSARGEGRRRCWHIDEPRLACLTPRRGGPGMRDAKGRAGWQGGPHQADACRCGDHLREPRPAGAEAGAERARQDARPSRVGLPLPASGGAAGPRLWSRE